MTPALEGAAGAIEHGVQVAAFQQELALAHRGVVAVGEEGVLDNHTRPATGPEHLDKVLEKEKRGLAGADGEVLLDLLTLLTAEGRIGEDDVVSVLLLDVGKVFRQRVGMQDVRGLDAVQDQVHDRDDIGQRLLLLAVQGLFLKRLDVAGGELAAGLQEVERLAEKARRATSAVVDGTWTMVRMSERGV